MYLNAYANIADAVRYHSGVVGRVSFSAMIWSRLNHLACLTIPMICERIEHFGIR